MWATYAKRVETLEDQDLQEIYQELMNFSTVVARGAYLVEEFPILAKVIPRSLQWWRPYGERLHSLEANLWLRLWRQLAAKMESGTADFCYVRGFMEQKYKEMGVSELQGAYIAGSMIEVRFHGKYTSDPAIGRVRHYEYDDKLVDLGTYCPPESGKEGARRIG